MEFHNTGAAYPNEFLPYSNVLTLGIYNIFVYLKIIFEVFLTTKSERTGGDKTLITLYVSMAIFLVIIT